MTRPENELEYQGMQEENPFRAPVRYDESQIRLYIGAGGLGGGSDALVEGPRLQKSELDGFALTVAPSGCPDPGDFDTFITTLKSIPDLSTTGDEYGTDLSSIRLYLSRSTQNNPQLISGPPLPGNTMRGHRVFIAPKGVQPPGGMSTLLCQINELPEWAAQYDPQRSLDHARRAQILARKRCHSFKP